LIFTISWNILTNRFVIHIFQIHSRYLLILIFFQWELVTIWIIKFLLFIIEIEISPGFITERLMCFVFKVTNHLFALNYSNYIVVINQLYILLLNLFLLICNSLQAFKISFGLALTLPIQYERFVCLYEISLLFLIDWGLDDRHLDRDLSYLSCFSGYIFCLSGYIFCLSGYIFCYYSIFLISWIFCYIFCLSNFSWYLSCCLSCYIFCLSNFSCCLSCCIQFNICIILKAILFASLLDIDPPYSTICSKILCWSYMLIRVGAHFIWFWHIKMKNI